MSSRVFWGTLLIIVGALFLMSNIGVLPWGVWNTLWRGWPILLVLWGVSILLRPLGRVGGLVMGLVALVAVAGLVAYSYAYQPWNGHYEYSYNTRAGQVPLDQPLESGVERVALSLDFGAGRINLDGQAAAAKLAEGTLDFYTREPAISYSGSADARLGITMGSVHWTGPAPKTLEWLIHLNPAPVYTMDLNTGACEASLDLSKLKVTDLSLDTGASDTTVFFGDPGQNARATFNFGAASLKVRVPRSVGVKVHFSSALVGQNLASVGFTKSGSDWVSAGYNEKTSHLDIEASAGAASFDLQWTD